MTTQNHWTTRKYILMHDGHAGAVKWSQQTQLNHITFPLNGADFKLLTNDAVLILVEPELAHVEHAASELKESPIFVIGGNVPANHPQVWAKLPDTFLEDDTYLNTTFLPYWQNAVLLSSDDVGAFKSEKF